METLYEFRKVFRYRPLQTASRGSKIPSECREVVALEQDWSQDQGARNSSRSDQEAVEEPDMASSVQILNPEDKQGKKNGVPNWESGRGKPVADPKAKGWLDSIQRLRAEWQHQINQFLQREAYGSLSKQDKLSITREAEKFCAVEDEFQKFIEKSPK